MVLNAIALNAWIIFVLLFGICWELNYREHNKDSDRDWSEQINGKH